MGLTRIEFSVIKGVALRWHRVATRSTVIRIKANGISHFRVM